MKRILGQSSIFERLPKVKKDIKEARKRVITNIQRRTGQRNILHATVQPSDPTSAAKLSPKTVTQTPVLEPMEEPVKFENFRPKKPIDLKLIKQMTSMRDLVQTARISEKPSFKKRTSIES
jgi:hypothetical protein